MDQDPLRPSLERRLCEDCGMVVANNEFARSQHRRSQTHQRTVAARDLQQRRARRVLAEAQAELERVDNTPEP